MKKKKRLPYGHFDDLMIEMLQEDEKMRQRFLKSLFEDAEMREHSPDSYRYCLSLYIKAVGCDKIAKETAMSRSNVYRILDVKQDMKFSTVEKIIKHAGLNIKLVPAKTK